MINSFSAFQASSALFGRAYSLAIGKPNQTAALQYGNVGKDPAPLRVKFDINKFSSGPSGRAKIEIYNLSQQSRQAIDQGQVVLLKAGYQKVFDQLFVGNIVPLGFESTRSGPDIITKIECGDGESSIIMARLDKSYPAGTSVLQILQDCAGAMHTEDSFNPQGTDSGIVFLPLNPVYNNGFVAKGPVSDTLTAILKPLGLEWSVQNGDLNVLPKTGHNGQTAIVISSATGMIGVPSGTKQLMKFTNLLNPKILPGSLIKLVSENSSLNGFYRVRNGHYEGDTHENKWQVECECLPMPNIVQNLANISLLSGVA